jgi:tetratricopeptide (TPR) repeat protein
MRGGNNKMNENCKPVEKQIFISLIVFILLLGPNFSFGQKHFYMKEKQMYEKFKMANKDFLKGKEYFLKGNYKKSEKELKKCIETMPEHVEAHFYLSQVLYKKEEFQKALEHIEKAKENFELMADLFAYAYQQYILQLREQEDTLDSQISELREKLSRTSDADTIRGLEAQISSLEQKSGTIINRQTGPVPPSESMPANYFYFHGNIFFMLKKYQEAFREYLETIKINPQHGNAYNNLANLYHMGKEYQKALDCLNQAEANGAEINPKLKKTILKALGK